MKNPTLRVRRMLMCSVLTAVLAAGNGVVAAQADDINIGTGIWDQGGSAGIVPKESRWDPRAVGRRCASSGGSKAELGLFSSLRAGASQITPKDGDYVPVLLVHGWTGDAKSFTGISDRSSPGYPASKLSLVGQLQAISGAAVYGYDYSKQSARWITTTADGLAAAIRCLGDQSGHRVIIVTHSMGGLNARLALQKTGVAQHVSRVINFGTPVKGSRIARDVWALTGERDEQQGVWRFNTTQKQILQQFFRSYLFNCSQLGDAGKLESCGKFTGLPRLITNFEGDAGRNLRELSRPMAAITDQKWPRGIDVYSLYGNFDLGYLGKSVNSRNAMKLWVPILNSLSSKLNTASLLNDAPRARWLDLKHPGDLVVTTDSAEYDTPKSHRYALRCAPFDSNAGDKIHSTTGASPMASPCFHGNLFLSSYLSARAKKLVAAQVREDIAPWSETKPDTEAGPANWIVTLNSVGPLRMGDPVLQVSAVTGVEYRTYLHRFLAYNAFDPEFDTPETMRYCGWASYSPLTKVPGMMAQFNPDVFPNTKDIDKLTEGEKLTGIWILSTGDAQADAKLPRMASGVGLGSTAAQLKAAFANPTGLDDGMTLRDITDFVREQDAAELAGGDQVFWVSDRGKVNGAQREFGLMQFKLHDDRIVAMHVSPLGNYAEVPHICKRLKKELVPLD